MKEERKTLTYEWEYGKEELTIQVDSYVNGRGLYIELYDKEESFCDMTINLPGYFLEPDEAFIDDFDRESKLRFIKEHKLGKVLSEMGQSGMGRYALVAFDLNRLAEFDKAGVERYKELRGLTEKEKPTDKKVQDSRNVNGIKI